MFLLFGSATCSTYTMYYCVFLLLTASYTPRRESNDLEHGVKVFPCAQRTAKTASALARLRRNWCKTGRRPRPLARGNAKRSRAANDKILAATPFIGVRRLFLRRVPLFNRHCDEQNEEFPAWIQPSRTTVREGKELEINRKKTHGTLRCICIEPCHNRYLLAM